MEGWQRDIIVSNLDKLVSNTICKVGLLASLQASEVLSAEDVEEIDELGSSKSRTAQSHKLYSIILTRANAFDVLLEGLQVTKQSGALKILIGDKEEHDDFKSVSFDKQAVLGKGSYGTVYRGKLGDREVAVKRIHTEHLDCTLAVHEIKVLKSCDMHENIVRYFGSKKSFQYLLILLEICEMTLSKWVGEEEKSIDATPLEVLRQTTVGLGWLHEHNIIHRDLKPDNILFTRNPVRVKISDFGLSRKIVAGKSFVSASSIGGTQGWVAPEILTQALNGNIGNCKFTYASDVFALGCVYYFVMANGKHPFGDLFRCQANILDGKAVLEENLILYGCRQNILFVKLMISQNPKLRPRCPALLTCPIFWATDRHIRFILDLSALNQEFLSTVVTTTTCGNCPFHQSREYQIMYLMGYHRNNLSLCSNNATYLLNASLGTVLPKYYISGAEFDIQEITEYLNCTTTNLIDSSSLADDVSARFLQKSNCKQGEDGKGQIAKVKPHFDAQSEKQNSEDQAEKGQTANNIYYRGAALDSTERNSTLSGSSKTFDEELDSHEVTRTGKPVQIISLSKPTDDPNAPCEIKLHESNLKTVLQYADDRPLCIISLVGPSQNGKRLLLNYIKLALEAMENGNKDFDIDNSEHRVWRFQYNAKNEPQTEGIWAWSNAFLIEDDEKELAVILLDSQGLNDDLMTSEKFSSILGLSFLNSSIFIYLIANDITLNNFEPLIPYFKYGLLCKAADEECTDEPPFRKFSIVVQDWSNHSKYNYGDEGGKTLLRQTTKTFPPYIRKAFSNCFHQVEAYLMPHIDKIEHQKPLTSAITQLDPEYKFHIRSYIRRLLAKGNLHTTKVLGNNITALDFTLYLNNFCNFFNSNSKSGRFITEDELFKVRYETLHESIIAKSLGKYKQYMDKKLKSSKYIVEDVLQATNKIARKVATANFEKADKLEEFKGEFEKRLQSKLDEEFKAIKHSNSTSRAAYVTESTRMSREAYKNTLQRAITFESNELTIYDDDFIQLTSQNIMKTVIEDFMKNFRNEDQKNVPSLRETLHQDLVSTSQPFLEQNNKNKTEANQILSDISSKIVKEYIASMTLLMTDYPFVETPVLQQLHTINMKKALESFDTSKKPGNATMIDGHRMGMKTELGMLFSKFSNSQIQKLDAKMKEQLKVEQERARLHSEQKRREEEEKKCAKFVKNAVEELERQLKDQLDRWLKQTLNIGTIDHCQQMYENCLQRTLDNMMSTDMSVVEFHKVREVFIESSKVAKEKLERIHTVVSAFHSHVDSVMKKTCCLDSESMVQELTHRIEDDDKCVMKYAQLGCSKLAPIYMSQNENIAAYENNLLLRACWHIRKVYNEKLDEATGKYHYSPKQIFEFHSTLTHFCIETVRSTFRVTGNASSTYTFIAIETEKQLNKQLAKDYETYKLLNLKKVKQLHVKTMEIIRKHKAAYCSQMENILKEWPNGIPGGALETQHLTISEGVINDMKKQLRESITQLEPLQGSVNIILNYINLLWANFNRLNGEQLDLSKKLYSKNSSHTHEKNSSLNLPY